MSVTIKYLNPLAHIELDTVFLINLKTKVRDLNPLAHIELDADSVYQKIGKTKFKSTSSYRARPIETAYDACGIDI